jgi:predicted small secreted protein
VRCGIALAPLVIARSEATTQSSERALDCVAALAMTAMKFPRSTFELERISIMRALTLLLLTGCLALAACNTIQGAGEDVASVGHTVAKTANSAKP